MAKMRTNRGPLAMVSRAHRWPADNHPLTAAHGGTKAAAAAAIKDASQPRQPRPKSKKALERERAVEAARLRIELILAKLPPAPAIRQDKMRPAASPAHTSKERQHRRNQWLRILTDQQDGRCAYCAQRMGLFCHDRSLRATFDHIVPLSKGGGDTFENGCAACFGCNNEKSDMDAEDYRAFRRARLSTPAKDPTP